MKYIFTYISNYIQNNKEYALDSYINSNVYKVLKNRKDGVFCVVFQLLNHLLK